MRDSNKAKGVIFGLAIGDALGARTEFMKLDQIKAKYGKEGIRDLPSPALFTDDTQMSVAIAEALVTAGDKDIELIMEAVREEFIKWSHLPETYKKAPGNTCLKGVATWSGEFIGQRAGFRIQKAAVRPCAQRRSATSISMTLISSRKWLMPQASAPMAILPGMPPALELPT